MTIKDRTYSRSLRLAVPVVTAILIGTSCTLGEGRNEATDAYQIDESVTALHLQARAGTISISAGEGPISVRETLRYDKAKPKSSHEVQAGTLKLVDSGCGNGHHCSIDYDITIPAATQVMVENEAGSIHTQNLTGDVNLKSEAGNITAEDLESVTAELSTEAGDVTATFVTAPTNAQASSEAGDINLTVPAGTSYNVQAHTDIGHPKIEVPTDAASPHVIHLYTEAGSAEVRTAPPAGNTGASAN